MADSKMKQIEQKLQEYRQRRKAVELAAKPPEPEPTPAHVPMEPELNRIDYFAIDVLNFYPFRKWREFCASDPLRCWISTGCFWLTGQLLASHAHFGIVYFLFSLFLLLFLNLGSRKEGELSAYSVFNPNCTRLLGQMTSEHFERDMMMRREVDAEEET